MRKKDVISLFVNNSLFRQDFFDAVLTCSAEQNEVKDWGGEFDEEPKVRDHALATFTVYYGADSVLYAMCNFEFTNRGGYYSGAVPQLSVSHNFATGQTRAHHHGQSRQSFYDSMPKSVKMQTFRRSLSGQILEW